MRTQLEAYASIKESLSTRRLKVLQAIKRNRGATLFELVGLLGWPINCISGRVTELKQKGLVMDSGRRKINPLSNKKGAVFVSTKAAKK